MLEFCPRPKVREWCLSRAKNAQFSRTGRFSVGQVTFYAHLIDEQAEHINLALGKSYARLAPSCPLVSPKGKLGKVSCSLQLFTKV